MYSCVSSEEADGRARLCGGQRRLLGRNGDRTHLALRLLHESRDAQHKVSRLPHGVQHRRLQRLSDRRLANPCTPRAPLRRRRALPLFVQSVRRRRIAERCITYDWCANSFCITLHVCRVFNIPYEFCIEVQSILRYVYSFMYSYVVYMYTLQYTHNHKFGSRRSHHL